jgi:hypothetical protein
VFQTSQQDLISFPNLVSEPKPNNSRPRDRYFSIANPEKLQNSENEICQKTNEKISHKEKTFFGMRVFCE